MDSEKKRRLEHRIVDKVSQSIIYKLESFDKMRNAFWEARYKSKNKCIPPNINDTGAHYAFESFFYNCLKKWEEGDNKI